MERESGRERMGRTGRVGRPLLVALILFMALGIAVYFRLWVIDSRISSDDTELLRQQFDLANKEAMDESAEWRFKYDEEKEMTAKCVQELNQIKKSLEKKAEITHSINSKLEMLQKENIDLFRRLESLEQELESEKLKCKSH
ncbi:hypothetical protein Nepgr_011632 [Nepenthes gracilis]|uniref:Uncharacterized protein n=1 Tax=Nepenthes gracilis TaxID=150966 RepID=A0AAD3SFV5_NEPGR|nr:hypothetical protein Nepgr_011632 [Nepenthes gracilis]